MRNLLIEQLDPRAKVIKGFTKPMCMLQGLDESFDAAVFIGYHSCAGTEGGVLAHTLLGKEIHNVLLDDEPMGETRLNALVAGHFGVPVAFLSGDTACCTEARRVLGADLPTFAVKDGIDMFSATCLHPEVTSAGIRAGVKNALGSAALKKRKPYRVPGEHRFGIEWNTTTIASMCALIPGIRKVTPRLTEFTNMDLPQAMGIIFAELLLALQVGQKKIYG